MVKHDKHTAKGYQAYESMKDLLDCINFGPHLNLDPKDPAIQNAKFNHFQYQQYEKTVKGKNQTLISKTFISKDPEHEPYNGPTQNDFINRLNILFETAEKIIKEKDTGLKAQINLLKLKKARITALAKIKEVTIKPYKLDELLAQEPVVITAIKKAQNEICKFVNKARKITETKASFMMEKESDLTAEKGRPNFVNHYPIGKQLRVSIARTIGDAIPSTMRNKPQLPNFVECWIGYKENNEYIPQFKGYRHSSYTPLQIRDSFEREQGAAECVKDMLKELAKHEIHHAKDGVIHISLASMALLSPIKYDPIVSGSEAEHKQLKESYDALMMYNDRVITLEIDGKLYQVKPTLNLMNARSNWWGNFAAHAGKGTLENNINAQGMNKFMDEAEKHFELPFKHSINKKHKKLLDRLNEDLQKKYELLDAHLNHTAPQNAQPYAATKQEIKKIREHIYKLEHEILKERLDAYEAHRETCSEFKISELINMEHLSESERIAKTKQLEIADLYFQAVFMYKDQTIEPSQFAALYLLTNEKMGKSVDFFCKSGEDRTGRIQNLIEEYCAFKKEHKHYPAYNIIKKEPAANDEKKLIDIRKRVNEFSVSRDINDQNAHGTRGLQITSGIAINQGLPNDSGNLLAKTAKSAYGKFAFLFDAINNLKYAFSSKAKQIKFMMNYFTSLENNVHLSDEKSPILNIFDPEIQKWLLEEYKDKNTDERNTILFLATLLELESVPDETKAMIRKQAGFTQEKTNHSVTTGPSATFNKKSLKDFNWSALALIKVSEHVNIASTGDKLQMILPSPSENRSFYSDPKDNLRSHMNTLFLMEKGKAEKRKDTSGKITIKIYENDPKQAELLKRRAYEACRKNLYKEDKITLLVNDVEVTLAEKKSLFSFEAAQRELKSALGMLHGSEKQDETKDNKHGV